MNDIRFALALALVATVFTLGRADYYKSMIVRRFPECMELRRVSPLAWMCCTNLTSTSKIAESDKVLQDFADGQNDQKRSVYLTAFSIASIVDKKSGRKCKYAPEITSDNVPTSPLVTMMEGFTLEYFVMQANDSSDYSMRWAYYALLGEIRDYKSDSGLAPFFPMTIVETTPENEVYVGVARETNSDIRSMLPG